MKRTFNTTQNTNMANSKPDAMLEGVIVTVSEISDNQNEKKGKYWTALLCDSNQNINRITKYLSSRAMCTRHRKMMEYLNNESSIRLNKLKCSGEKTYTATAETIGTPIDLSLTPLCTQITTIKNIQSMSDEEYISFNCKILDIGSDEVVVFNNAQKRVQKLKRSTVVADKTDFINMNIWENNFDSIKKDQCYLIKLAKVKIFNDELSITTTTHTKFEPIEDITDVMAYDSIQILQESAIAGVITSIGLIEHRSICPKCYSTDIECNDKTIKCIACKSRSLYVKQSVEQKEMKLNVIDANQKRFEFIVKTSQIQALLEESNHQELCHNDLVENEDVLLALSSINVFVNFNPKTMHINTIVLNNIDNK
ncbi:unnamed protein product [Rotaria magnacalcarata]|uniref:Uncharacterized protein n=2 Tax=Rotaria magnacalcarata TaxID=392030 RepID=A0A819KAR5_9BILA|nr:unnamed protein product [Rotaria magnacalcarata]CAF3941299.1 unnamed protein product [Rotaria magnacalcarata]